MKPKRADLRPERFGLKPERFCLRPEKADFRLERADIKKGTKNSKWKMEKQKIALCGGLLHWPLHCPQTGLKP